jgi:hypothetical protein
MRKVNWDKAPKNATHAMTNKLDDIRFAIKVYDTYLTTDRLATYMLSDWHVLEERPKATNEKCLKTESSSIAERPEQVGGNHYGSGVDVFKWSLERKHDCLQHAAIKYIDRHHLKNGVDDINKAISVLERIKFEQYGNKQ